MTNRFSKADSFRRVTSRLMPVFAAAFGATFVLSSIIAPTKSTSAIDDNQSNDEYYALINAQDVTLNVLSIPTGAMTVVSSTVKATTNNPYGYTLYIGMAPTDSEGHEKSAADKLKNGLYLDEDLSSTSLVAAAGATGESPEALAANSWGYAVDSATTGVPEAWQGLTHQARLNVEPTDEKFAAVPAVGSEEVVQKTDTNNVEGEWQESYWEDSSKYSTATVWYGINANTSLPDGAYSNTIAYTAVANPRPTAYTLNFAAGTEETVTNLPSTMTYSGAEAQHIFNIPNNIPVYAGHIFVGYTDGVNTYQPGSAITVVGTEQFVGSATLTAEWVTMDGCTNGGNRVCYISNEPSGTVSGSMEDQTIAYMTSETPASISSVDTTALSASTTELTLYSPNWSLAGYGFKGWNTKADGSGTMYGPNQTITLTHEQQSQLGVVGLPLYAQWVASVGEMASWSGCGSLNDGDITALSYGGTPYAIAKLADGKCWMIENLKRDNSTDAGTLTYSFSTTSYNSREYNVANVGGADGSYPINLTSPAANYYTTSKYQWKSYGGYYSWASAIGVTATSSSQYYNYNTATSAFTASGTTKGICPTGWRVPRSYYGSTTNNRQSDFRYLNSVLNGTYSSSSTFASSNIWRTYPNNFVFSGSWESTNSMMRGTNGSYWSSTVYDSSHAYFLSLNSDSIFPQNPNGDKNDGKAVRCVIGD